MRGISSVAPSVASCVFSRDYRTGRPCANRSSQPKIARPSLPLGGFERFDAVENAINVLISPETKRREYFGHERLVSTLYRAVKPDPAVLEFAQRVAGIATLAGAIRAKLSPDPPDISEIMGQSTDLLNESITGLNVPKSGPPPIDLSKINFEALAERFKESKHKKTEEE